MKKIFKNYKLSIILIISIIIGGIIGLIFKEKATILSPFGDLFLNLLLVSIIPLIFLTLTTSIGKMKSPKRLGKILVTTIIVFIITSLLSVFVGLFSTKIPLVKTNNQDIIEKLDVEEESERVNILERTINTISVNDFYKLLSKENLVAVIIFSLLIGISINLTKEKSKDFFNVLISANEVIQTFIKVIMYYAPIGLGCYFASLVGNIGSSLIVGYGKTFIIYFITSIFVYFIIYSIYTLIAGGKKCFIAYWKNIIPASITAIATCSSAASIPVNTKCVENIGVSTDIANSVVPLGTSFHKDGSIIGSVFKIMFLVYLFNANIPTLEIIGVALLATLLVVAVPIGGGTISEMVIITMLGFPVAALPILTIIATIIDAPATLLNVVGDSASSTLVARFVDGKNWLKKFK